MSTTITEKRLCSGCGSPLAEDGSIDVRRLEDGSIDAQRLADAARERSLTFAMREDHAQVEARLAQAQTALETAKRHKDAAAIPAASRRVEELSARLEHVDEQLRQMPATPTPPEGKCPDCGAPFRGGRPDLQAVREMSVARAEKKSQLVALEQELDAAHRQVAAELQGAALAEKRALTARDAGADNQVALVHRKRASNAQGRIVAVEAAILHARGELAEGAPAARADVRAFVGRNPRGEKRASTRGK